MEKNKTSARKPNIAVQRRKFNKLSLIDNALFMAVVGSKDGSEFCRIVIETVLGRKADTMSAFRMCRHYIPVRATILFRIQ